MFHSLRPVRVAVAAAALALGGGLAVASPSAPAHAAAFEKTCFVWSSGSAYANQPVYLEKWTSTGWKSVRSGTTNSGGCASFSNVPTNVYTTIHAYKVVGNSSIGLAIFSGYPPLYANPGTGGVNLGTGRVPLVQCVAGLYGRCAGF